MEDDLPLFSGEVERDKGIAQVTEHNERWMDLAIREAKKYIAYRRVCFTGEDIRFHCQKLIGLPSHPNAFGALILHLINKKLIRKTGQYVKMKDENSHARSTPVYEATQPF